MENLAVKLAKANESYSNEQDRKYGSVRGMVMRHMRDVAIAHFSKKDAKGKVKRLPTSKDAESSVPIDKVWIEFIDDEGNKQEISQQILASNIQPSVSQLVGLNVTVHLSTFEYGKDHKLSGQEGVGFQFMDVDVNTSFELKARMLNPNQPVHL